MAARFTGLGRQRVPELTGLQQLIVDAFLAKGGEFVGDFDGKLAARYPAADDITVCHFVCGRNLRIGEYRQVLRALRAGAQVAAACGDVRSVCDISDGDGQYVDIDIDTGAERPTDYALGSLS
jgi:hypothetical protein